MGNKVLTIRIALVILTCGCIFCAKQFYILETVNQELIWELRHHRKPSVDSVHAYNESVSGINDFLFFQELKLENLSYIKYFMTLDTPYEKTHALDFIENAMDKFPNNHKILIIYLRLLAFDTTPDIEYFNERLDSLLATYRFDSWTQHMIGELIFKNWRILSEENKGLAKSLVMHALKHVHTDTYYLKLLKEYEQVATSVSRTKF